MPLFDHLAARLGDRVRVIGLNSGDTLGQAQKFAETVGVHYDLWLDDDRRGSTALKVTALPVTVFVTADGLITKTKLGAFDAAELDATVQELLGA
jgi:peroxiredoxin